jgi:ABC-type branched-subunit amino acid transport system substrate-binding protein
MKSPATIISSIVIILALIITSACSTKTTTQTTGTQQSKIFNLGALLPESGFGSSFGVPAMDGVRLAVQQINEAGGFTVDGQNYKIQLHEYDDGDPTKEAAGATQLVQDGCSIILYEGSSDSAVQAVTEPAKCLLVIAGAPPTVTGPGIKYTFCIENSALGSSFWPAMLSGPGGNTLISGVKTVGILTEDYSTCVAARPGFIAACEAQGLKVVFDETVESDTTDYSAVVAKLMQADPDVLFFNSTASSTVLNLFPQMAEQNYYPITFGYDSINSRPPAVKEIATSGANGTVEILVPGDVANGIGAMLPDWASSIVGLDPAKLASYTQGMATSYPGNDSGAALIYYDFTYAMVYHMTRANSINTDAISASMTSGAVYNGAGGKYYWYSQNHMMPATLIAVRVDNINDKTGTCTYDFIGGGSPTDYTYKTWNFTVKEPINVQQTRSRAALVNVPQQ